MPAPHPRMHGLAHAPGGPDPIPSSGGIQFDTTPQTGGFLVVETTGNVPGSPDDGMQLYADNADIEIVATGASSSEGNVFINGHAGVGISGQGDEGVVIDASGAGDILIEVTGSGGAYVTINVPAASGHLLRISGLPSSNPGGAGGNFVWRDSSGFLRIG